MPQRLHLSLSGIVQGVGFRPFVHRLAYELGLGGWVQNQSGTVLIEVEGDAAVLGAFRLRLIQDAPPLARPEILATRSEEIPRARSGFVILESHCGDAADIHLPPDTHLCEDCRR